MIKGLLLANGYKLLAVIILLIFYFVPFQTIFAQRSSEEICLVIPEDYKKFVNHLENQCITHSTDCHQFAVATQTNPGEKNYKFTYPNENIAEAACERIKNAEAETQCLTTDPSMLRNFPFDCLRYESDCLVYIEATSNRSDCVAHFAVAKNDIEYCEALHPYNPIYCKVAYAVITRDANLCDQFDKSEGCYSRISDIEIQKCTDLQNDSDMKECVFEVSAENNTTFHCRTLLKDFDDRLDCIIHVASTNNDPSRCSYKNDVHGKASYICSEIMCEKFELQEEKASCYLNNLGTVPNLEMCSYLGNTHVQDECYDNFARFSDAGDHFKISIMDRRKACSMITDFKDKKLCKFYSGIFPDRTIFQVSFGFIAIFALFYYLISVYRKRFKRSPSRKLLISCGILLGIAQLFLTSILFTVPVAGMFTDHIFMIVKMLCPPDGSGNCTSGGWLSFITFKGIFVYFIVSPLICVVLALLALRLNLLFSNNRGNGEKMFKQGSENK